MNSPDTTTADHSIAPPVEPLMRHTARVFLCPSCDSRLEYQGTHVEESGVPADLTDYYQCPTGCGAFEYERKRHRLRHSACDHPWRCAPIAGFPLRPDVVR
jgi:hypothetical protein